MIQYNDLRKVILRTPVYMYFRQCSLLYGGEKRRPEMRLSSQAEEKGEDSSFSSHFPLFLAESPFLWILQ